MNYKTKLAPNKSKLDTLIDELENAQARLKKRPAVRHDEGSLFDRVFGSIGRQYGLKAKVTADSISAGADDPMPAIDDPRVILENVIAAIDDGISVDDLRAAVADYLAQLDGGTDAEKMVQGKVFGVKVNPSRSPYSQSKAAARTRPADPIYGVGVDKSRSPFKKR